MGKAKKEKSTAAARNQPLEQQIIESSTAKPKSRTKNRRQKIEDEEFVDAGLSKKILQAARQQQKELAEPGEGAGAPGALMTSFSRPMPGSDSDAEEEEVEDDMQQPDMYYEDIAVDEEDERALQMFMADKPEKTRTLADVIQEKIQEKHTELREQLSEAGDLQMTPLDPRVQQLYEGVRDVLKRYRSGKLPKAFKMIPNLRNWEQVLYVTEPQSWSAASVYQATRIFASNLKEKMAQRFYNLVLLPRIRDDIAEFKKINFHLYQALRKALYKPGAFMKGIVLPLLESGNCTLREAVIIGSVLGRNSVPLLHSCAALLKVAEMGYTGANSIILRIFLDKKYALPYRVVDAVVFHFLRFERDYRELPVLWHQALLTLAQRYKADISTEQREALLALLRRHSHPSITPEIRRELQSAVCRDGEVTEPSNNSMLTD